ncbi:hypothetical protein BDP27DRAFT_1325889 [Rhodocollybia butyracea]|uniref:Aminoglycoside phosphotransferase domain-containing protein n=1 Tax=Rhodocollybia butyracea TaxID=206335 RepID=A0A9P5PWF2_9AGAR|nr:hypothetical protein BDP27DRAFT_1325889 [Rhodocollybia butyracea]
MHTNSAWTSLIESACALLGNKLQATMAVARKPFNSNDVVMELHLDDNRTVFVRVLTQQSSDNSTTRWLQGRHTSEISILQWLEMVAPNVPVSRVLAVDSVNGIIVTTYIPGLDAFHAYPLLKASAKEHSVVSWAQLALKLFRTSSPQCFGTPHAIEGTMLRLGVHIGLSPGHCFDVGGSTNLRTFFASAVESRISRSAILYANEPETHSLLCQRVARLFEGLESLMVELDSDPALSRFVLTHTDPRPDNVILDPVSGEVLAIVDWEYVSCFPAAMAAQYPEWIRSPIVGTQRYRNSKTTLLHYTLEPKAERERLCNLYEEYMQRHDPEYHRCLIWGIRLRDAYVWITSPNDPDGEAMDKWVTEHLLGVTADHRCA